MRSQAFESQTQPAAMPASLAGDPLRPPLDAGSGPREAQAGSWLALSLVTALVAGLAGFVAIRMAAADGGAGLGWLLMVLACIVAAVWLQVVIHELGHTLAALACGQRPLAFGIGPLHLERGPDGWRLRARGLGRGVSGYALMLPAPDRSRPRRDAALYLAAGPLANLLVAGFAAALLGAGQPGPWQATLLWCLLAFGLLLGLINLLPWSASTWHSDGMALVDLWRRPALAEGLRRLQTAGALIALGQRPRDWPAQAVPVLLPDQAEPALRRDAAWLKLVHALDAQQAVDAEQAARALVPYWAQAPEGLRQAMALTLAEHSARHRRDPELVEAWLAAAQGGGEAFDALRDWLAGEAALLRGDSSAARAAMTRARAALARVPNRLAREQIAESIDALDQRLGPALAGG